jgi:hypothetical protein
MRESNPAPEMTTQSNMPPDVGASHELLVRELMLLNTKWNDFKLLFCRSDANVRRLHDVAELFFQIVREVLADDIILGICRITDPATSRVKGVQRANLTLDRIESLLPKSNAAKVRKIRNRLLAVRAACEPFRKHRNRRVGHFDLDTRMRRAGNLLPGISIRGTNRALKSIAGFLNAVAKFYAEDVRSYQHGIAGPGSRELLEFTKRANRLEVYFEKNEFGTAKKR